MNLYLKLLLVLGTPFAVVAGTFFALFWGLSTGLIIGLSTGLLFGGLMALSFGSLHIWSVRRMPAGRSEGALSVHHVREVELQLLYDEAFDLCVSSLASVRKCRILTKDRSQGKIDARAVLDGFPASPHSL